MADHIDDGGPAFPCLPPLGADNTAAAGYPYVSAGASLRDLFALAAMHAHLITDAVPGEACDALLEAAAHAGREPLDHLCFNAYEVADAMLKARAAR